MTGFVFELRNNDDHDEKFSLSFQRQPVGYCYVTGWEILASLARRRIPARAIDNKARSFIIDTIKRRQNDHHSRAK